MVDSTTDALRQGTVMKQIRALAKYIDEKISGDIQDKIDAKQDKLTAGTGIVLEENIISTIINPDDYYDKTEVDIINNLTISTLQAKIDADKLATVTVDDGDDAGTLVAKVRTGDGTIYTSAPFNYRKLYNVEIIAGSTPNSLKIRYTLTDNTTLTSNEYVVGVIYEDKYMTALSFTPDLVNGTIQATISYNDGTTALSNTVAVPLGRTQMEQIQQKIDDTIETLTMVLDSSYVLNLYQNSTLIDSVDLSVFGGGYSRSEVDALLDAKVDDTEVSVNVMNNTIPKRTSTGTVKASNGVEPNDCVTVQQVALRPQPSDRPTIIGSFTRNGYYSIESIGDGYEIVLPQISPSTTYLYKNHYIREVDLGDAEYILNNVFCDTNHSISAGTDITKNFQFIKISEIPNDSVLTIYRTVVDAADSSSTNTRMVKTQVFNVLYRDRKLLLLGGYYSSETNYYQITAVGMEYVNSSENMDVRLTGTLYFSKSLTNITGLTLIKKTQS